MTAAPGTSNERSRRWALPAALGPRAQVAAGVVAGFVALTWADAVGLGGARPSWWLLPVAVLVAVGGAGEFAGLWAAGGVRVRRVLVQAATACLPVAAAVGAATVADVDPCAASITALGWVAFACVLAIAMLLTAEVVRYGREPRPLDRVAAGVLAVTMLGLPVAFLVALRIVGGTPAEGRGVLATVLPLVSLVAVVKGGDIAAYLVGSLVGRHRMAPRLSPGKTWEGAAASLAASVAIAWVCIETAAGSHRPLGGWLPFGLVCGGLGMLGDLSESLVKRERGAKDSGTALGRMGGVLDLVDSLVFAAPAAWALWQAGCRG